MKTPFKTIILAGSGDLNRCSLSSSVAGCLWPVLGVSVIERLLEDLSRQGVNDAVVCSNGSKSVIKVAVDRTRFESVRFLDEPFPVGSAGCVRDALSGNEDDPLIVVLQGSMVSPPSIEELLEHHERCGSDMTVFFNPKADDNCVPREDAADENYQSSGIYVLSSSVLEQIPEEGYFDIKESLIPALLSVGKKVSYAVLSKNVRNFRNCRQYLKSSADVFKDIESIGLDKYPGVENVWVGKDADIAEDARLVGPVAVLDGGFVGSNAVVIGPVVIGSSSTVGADSVVVNSIIWDHVKVGRGCHVSDSVITSKAQLDDGEAVVDSVARAKVYGVLEGVIKKFYKERREKMLLRDSHTMIANNPGTSNSRGLMSMPAVMAGVVLLVAAFAWSFLPNIAELWALWMKSDEFSCGLLVPFLTVYILWSRKERFKDVLIRPAVLSGALLLVFAQLVRFFGTFAMAPFFEKLSIVFGIFSIVLVLFGWGFFRKAFTVLLFLFLMLPWPSQVQARVTQPLQAWATGSAVFSLEMIGYDVVREGNIINLGDTSVAVAEACNGLRMITAFFVIIGLVVLLAKRPRWQKLVVLASSLPIALLCNTIRLTVTSIAFTYLDGPRWQTIFHDFGGYAMMPVALVMAIGLLWLLKALTSEPETVVEEVITRKS